MIDKPEEDEMFEYEYDASADNPSATSKTKPAQKYTFFLPHAKLTFPPNRPAAAPSMRSTSFKDFFLKEELMKAIADSGFEHPSEVQQECIPKAAYGNDILAQSKSGMGKTAIYVLGILNQMESTPAADAGLQAIVLTHTRELAFQAAKEFGRFGKYLPNIKVGVVYGGTSIDEQKKMLKENPSHILIGTPGRVATLAKNKVLVLDKVKYFVIDECDQMLKELGMIFFWFWTSKNNNPCHRHETGCAVRVRSYPSRKAGHDALCNIAKRITGSLQEILAVNCFRSFHRQRSQIDLARTKAILSKTRGERKESETL